MLYRKLSELKKLENNPRTIKIEDMEKLKKSIKKFWVLPARPLILSSRTWDLVIIGGNMRYEACKQLWIKEVPTELIENLTEEDENEIIIRDNVSNGDWNMEQLANEWNAKQLDEWWVDINFGDVENMDDNFSLPDWEKWEIETVTFTLHREQNELLQDALNLSKQQWAFINTWNENSNWNALARIIETYLTQNK